MSAFDLASRLHPNPALLALWRDGQHLVDCVLCADGQTANSGLRAHRIVLSAASAYLRALFCSEHWLPQRQDAHTLQVAHRPCHRDAALGQELPESVDPGCRNLRNEHLGLRR